MLSSQIHLLLSLHVISVLVCSIVLIVNAWLLIRLNVPSITASFLFSASSTRLYNSIFFTFILLPSIITLRGIPFAALWITSFSSIRQYILGLSSTNSMIQWPLYSSLKMGPGNFLLKLIDSFNEWDEYLSIRYS